MKDGKDIHLTEDVNFDLEKFPYYWLTRVNARYLQAMEDTLHKLEFDNSRRRILIMIANQDDLSISDIVQYTIMKISTVTKLVYRMEDEGYLTTYRCENDRRITRVRITSEGLEKIAAIYEGTKDITEGSFNGLTDDEIIKFNQVLIKMFQNLSIEKA